jgi:type IV secretory pathway TrbL component
MLDPNFITICFNVCVVKFFYIVTSYLLKLYFEFILCSLGKLLETCDHFSLVMMEEHPSVFGVVINFHKTIKIASQTLVSC